jgi:dihydrofolate synthase/folylpolyglutamate synthase
MKPKKVVEIESSFNYQKRLISKGVEYKKIDIDRTPRLYKKYSHLFNLPKSVHIVGTNGKGSTGRFLASMLFSSGLSVFHFSSPHIFRFNERFYIDGVYVSEKRLESAEAYLCTHMSSEDIDSLSYFEYSFFLALFLSQDVDIAIFEAGLGGEFDATSVLRYDLALVTPISLDHKEFLGDTLKEVATTKLKAIKSEAIFAKQDSEVVDVVSTLGLKYQTYEDVLDDAQTKMIKKFARDIYEEFIISNLLLSASAFKRLGFRIERDNLPKKLELEGRVQKIGDNIVVDVGHNVAAAEVLSKTFIDKKYNLVYNSLADKEYKSILEIFKKMTDKLYIIPIDAPRAVDEKLLRGMAKEMGYEIVENPDFKQENWLVFGSFYTAQAFLKRVDEG